MTGPVGSRRPSPVADALLNRLVRVTMVLLALASAALLVTAVLLR